MMRPANLMTLASLLCGVHLAHAEDRPVDIVVAVKGKVALRRPNWTGTTPVVFGTVLQFGDLLSPEGDGKATILCADLTLASSANILEGVPCHPGGQPELRWNGARVAPARSAAADFPKLLQPRATDLTDARPTIAWSPATGVGSYKVSVQGQNFEWTSPPTSGTEFEYPASAPSLKPETDYQVVVSGGGRDSREEGVPGAGFRLMGPVRTARVRDLERRIVAMALDDAPRRLAIAHLYAGERLLLAAIATLGTLQDASELAFRGDLQVKAQRPDLAIESYRQAVARASPDDLENGAYARKTLARLLLGTDDLEARKLLDEAKTAYKTIGDSDALTEIGRLLRSQ